MTDRFLCGASLLVCLVAVSALGCGGRSRRGTGVGVDGGGARDSGPAADGDVADMGTPFDSGGGGGDDGAVAMFDLTGGWLGTWTSSAGPFGTIDASLVQTSTSVSGTFTMHSELCALTAGNVEAILDRTDLYGTVGFGSASVTIQGIVSTDHVEGMYFVTSGLCSGDMGTYTLDR